MVPVSIVIITKNEAEGIADCLKMAVLISDDIVIVDNDSTDETLAIALAHGCRVYQDCWKGYGANKNAGIEQAKYDWILSIDADEVPDLDLIRSLHNLKLNDISSVYDIKFRLYFGKKPVRFGYWGRKHHVRLFNRKLVKWSEQQKVHENLIFPQGVKKKKIEGCLHHYSVKDVHECRSKAVFYAKLSAEEYLQRGKEANFINLFISPAFSFFMGYILLLGFLDGKEGWIVSKTIFMNKWLKYHHLNRKKQGRRKSPLLELTSS
ncbi:glycosyltransferase family 2 protein [Pedobacter sp. L105]|uniref:glycosyltransferase family 2 protein n=1 Tax=Pedobacter sp. L105 TaxID=1641871 RepID=UPI00131B47AA|nr:glycosyltransferase family 2 protein [Pedobacter sp. L105]